MELGEFHLFFFQYEGTGNRWFTRNYGFATFEGAVAAADAYGQEFNCRTRIVEQTTTNKVV